MNVTGRFDIAKLFSFSYSSSGKLTSRVKNATYLFQPISHTVKRDNKMKNPWSYWRPIYKYTWGVWQKSSYIHFCNFVATQKGLVLDVGTGTGEYIAGLPKHNHYIFSDVDSQSLEVARQRAATCLDHASFSIQVCDATTAIKAHANANIIAMIHVISVVADPYALLRTAIEQLPPGGILLVYISRFSKRFEFLCNPLSRALGFRLMDLNRLFPEWRCERAGWFNDCYIYQKLVVN